MKFWERLLSFYQCTPLPNSLIFVASGDLSVVKNQLCVEKRNEIQAFIVRQVPLLGEII